MRHLLIMVMIGLLGFGLSVDHAEAKRLGGGKSFGSYSRSADSGKSSSSLFGSNKATNSSTAAQSRPSSGLSRFAGPFAGLLAGGLLASLFFGGAFDGLRMTDFLIIALIAFVAFKLLRAAKKTATASNGPTGNVSTRHDDRPRNAHARKQHAQGASLAPVGGIGAGLKSGANINAPSWFNREQFLGGAKEHFMILQRAWDNNDLPRIQEYVTPELYNLLCEERTKQPANNQTEIVHLHADLSSIQEHDQQAEATVLFHGMIDENGEQSDFSESWHLIRELRDGADWHIQGIEQHK